MTALLAFDSRGRPLPGWAAIPVGAGLIALGLLRIRHELHHRGKTMPIAGGFMLITMGIAIAVAGVVATARA